MAIIWRHTDYHKTASECNQLAIACAHQEFGVLHALDNQLVSDNQKLKAFTDFSLSQRVSGLIFSLLQCEWEIRGFKKNIWTVPMTEHLIHITSFLDLFHISDWLSNYKQTHSLICHHGKTGKNSLEHWKIQHKPHRVVELLYTSTWF